MARSLTVARLSPEAAERGMRRLAGLAAIVVLVAAFGGIGRGVRRATTRRTDGTGPALRAVSLVAATAGFLGASAVLWRGLPVRMEPRVRAVAAGAGGAALLSGLGLYLAGMATLGREYNVSSTFGARLYGDQRLVTSGPCAIVRHPMYIGLMIAAGGGLLLYRTWTTLVFVAALPVLVVRARREEEALADRFGVAWAVYRERVPGWIPHFGPPGPASASASERTALGQ